MPDDKNETLAGDFYGTDPYSTGVRVEFPDVVNYVRTVADRLAKSLVQFQEADGQDGCTADYRATWVDAVTGQKWSVSVTRNYEDPEDDG